MKKKVLLLAGTKKGLFLLTSADRRHWSRTGPFQSGREINHAVFDARTGKTHATSNDAWFGCQVATSANLGKSWPMAKCNPAFDKRSGLKLERIWHLEPGRAKERNVVYAGVA